MLGLFHALSEVRQGQKTFPASSSDKNTRNYDTECSNHIPSHLPEGTRIELWEDQMVSYIYSTLPRNVRTRLSHP